ncbi:hypothetical protein V6615_13320 [Oscillospiraceae bacterium PP1C4]
MTKITISLKSLIEKTTQIEKDGMDLVTLCIVQGLIEDGKVYPTFIHIEGISKSESYKDYEGIDEASLVGMFANT